MIDLPLPLFTSLPHFSFSKMVTAGFARVDHCGLEKLFEADSGSKSQDREPNSAARHSSNTFETPSDPTSDGAGTKWQAH